MKNARIVLTHRVFPQTAERLERFGRVRTNETDQSPGPEALVSMCREAEAVMAFMPDRIDAALITQCPRLKIVAGALKGCDNIDLEACTRRGVWVSIVPDLLSVPTADLAVALLLALTRNVREGDGFVRSGQFRGWRPLLYGPGLAGKTAGILGFGKVGRLIARRLLAFDMRVCCCDPAGVDRTDPDALGVTPVGFEDLLAGSDAIVLAAPLTPSSLHLFGSDALARLKPGTCLVNVGRGSVVDEHAVAAALERGTLAGYAADVFELEDFSRADRPRAISPALLRQTTRTLFTPHLGSAVREVRQAIELAAAANIADVLEGRPPRDAVNLPPSDLRGSGRRVC